MVACQIQRDYVEKAFSEPMSMKLEILENWRKEKGIKPYNKVIISGNIIEVYSMDFLPNIEGELSSDDDYNPLDLENTKIDIEKWKEKNREQEKRAYSARRARNMIRRLVLANFDKHSKFITLTFRENLQDVKKANYEFKKFINRLRYKFKDDEKHKRFKYIAVIEFQQRGAVHYHMISDLPYISNDELNKVWGNGFVKINDISHVDNVGAYIVKYMSKELRDERLSGLKAYQCSKGLERPIVYRGYEADLLIESLGLNDKKIVFAGIYGSEYNGMIMYREYNLTRL